MKPRVRKAVHQALVCVAAAVLMAAALVIVQRQPTNADKLRISVADLRSQAADLDLLRTLSKQGRATPRFARAHAGQIDETVDATLDELSAMKVRPELAQPHAEARSLAAQLQQQVRQLEATDHAAAESHVAELKSLEERLSE